MTNAIRSAIIDLNLQDNNIVAKLSALNGASDVAVKSLGANAAKLNALNVATRQAQVSSAAYYAAILDQDAAQQKTMQTTAALSGFFGQMDTAAGQAAANQTLLGRATYAAESAIRSMAGSLQSAGASLVTFSENNKMALAAVSALSSAMVYQTTQTAAKQEAIQASFKAMAAKQGADADQLLANMRAATNNMVSDLDLMQNTVSAMSFGIPLEKLPESLELVRKAQLATGQDMNYLLQSMFRGVGRLSPLIIDNLGLQVSLEEANDKYAKTLGKSAANLTKEEQKQALLNATLEEGKIRYSAIDITSGKASDSLVQFNTAVSNLSGSIGTTFLPIASYAAEALTVLTGAVKSHPWATFTIAAGLAGAALGSMALLALPAVVKGLTILTGGNFMATLSTQGLTAAVTQSRIVMLLSSGATKTLAAMKWLLGSAISVSTYKTIANTIATGASNTILWISATATGILTTAKWLYIAATSAATLNTIKQIAAIGVLTLVSYTEATAMGIMTLANWLMAPSLDAVAVGASAAAVGLWAAAAPILAVIAPIAAVVLGVGALILVIQDLWTWMNGGKSLTGDFIKGLKPKNRVAAAFGSYGWAGGAVKQIEGIVKETGLDLVQAGLEVKYMPDKDDLARCIEFGSKFANAIKGR